MPIGTRPKISKPLFITRIGGGNAVSKKTKTKWKQKRELERNKVTVEYNRLLQANENRIKEIKQLCETYTSQVERLGRKLAQIESLNSSLKSRPTIENIKNTFESQLEELKRRLKQISKEKSNLQDEKLKLSNDQFKAIDNIYIKYLELLRRLEDYNFRKGIYKKEKLIKSTTSSDLLALRKELSKVTSNSRRKLIEEGIKRLEHQ